MLRQNIANRLGFDDDLILHQQVQSVQTNLYAPMDNGNRLLPDEGEERNHDAGREEATRNRPGSRMASWSEG